MTIQRVNQDQQRDIWCRELTLRAASVNEDERSIEGVFSTESPVSVYDWGRDEMIDEVLVSSGARYAQQIPFLDAHQRGSTTFQLGSATNMRDENGETVGKVRFLKDDPASDRAWKLVRDGHTKDLSVGYRVEQYTDIPPGETRSVAGKQFTAGKRRMRITTSYRIREVSLVPIGADQQAKIRADGPAPQTEIVTMKPELKKYLESLGLRAEATDEQAVAFREALGCEQAVRATAIDEGKEVFPPKVEPQRGSVPVAGQPGFPAGNVDHSEAIRAERERIEGIRKLATADTNPELIQRAISEGVSVADAGLMILRAEREATPKPASAFSYHSRGASKDINKQILAAGLMHRCGAPLVDKNASDEKRKEQERIAEQAERFRSMNLPDLARLACQIDGARDPETGMEPFTREEFIRAGLSTPTLSYAFSTNVNAMLTAAYEEAGDTTGWVEEVDVADFKSNEAISLGKQAGLELLPRGKTAAHATFSDEEETYSVRRYAKQFVIDEQDMIDDRLGAFQEVVPEMGRAAARLRPDLVYYLLLANPTLGVDSTAVFASGHSNTDTNVLNATNIKTGVTKMRKQQQNSVNLNIAPQYLVCATTLEWTAREILNSTQLLITGTTDTVRGNRNVVADLGLQLVTDARIDNGVTDPLTGAAASGTTTGWYLFSRPFRTLRVAYLAGSGRRPTVRQFILDRGTYGIGYDIKMDIGAKFMGYRGCYRGNT